MSRSRLLGAVCAYLISFTTLPAHGEPIRFDFTGVVVGSEIIEGPNQGLPLTGTPTNGALIGGYYIFDSEISDRDTSTLYGAYLNSIIEMEFNIGDLAYSFDLQSGGTSDIRTENGVSGGFRDRYTTILRGGDGDHIIGPALGSFVPSYFQFDIFDFEGGQDPDLITDDSLPLTPPDINLATDTLGVGDAELLPILLQYVDLGSAEYNRAQLHGTLTSLSLHTVPIPSAPWLFGSGLLGLIGVARRKKHLHNNGR